MTIQVELTWLIGLLTSFFGVVWAFGKVLVKQFDKRLDERFATQEALRVESQSHWETRFGKIESLARDTDRIMTLMRGEMPSQSTHLDDHAVRLSEVESRIEMMPSHEDLGDLHERINDISKAVHTLSGEMTGIKTTLGLIHQHLLNGGGRQ
jgi:hypothetical protein